MTDWLQSQIEERMRLDAAASERAYALLAASVSDSMRTPLITADEVEQADGAARACLKYCGVEPGQVPESILDLNERLDWLCRPSGTARRTVRLEPGWHKQAFGAMLGRLDTGEAVALLPRGVRGYSYIEPGTGRRVKVGGKAVEHLQDEAVLFYRPLPARALSVRDLVAFIFRAFDRTDYLLVFAAALAATLVGLAPAWANQVAFSIVVPSGRPTLIAPVGALLLGVAVSSALLAACRNLVMARVSTKLDVVTEAATFARLLELPTPFFKHYAAGNLASRVANVKLLTQQLAALLLGSGLTAVLSIAFIIQIGIYAPALAWPSLAIVLVQAALLAVSTHAAIRYERATQMAAAKLSGVETALLGGYQKIKLAGAEERAFAKWARSYADYAQPAYNRPTLVVALAGLVAFVGLLGTILIYYLASTSGMDVAGFMAYNAAWGQLSAAITALAALAGQIAQIQPMLGMVAPILETAPEVSEGKPSIESLSGAVEVSNIAFRYQENQPFVLDGLSFSVKAGEYVAIVGKSGCGKSTILRLLLGFEKPERGSVLYGPYDVQNVDLRSLRSHVGVVMQNAKLFMGDIASNITISTPSATIDDAWEAAELAGIADDIRKMPMGMQSLITEGSGGISGGQRQRIMIARAICGKRKILMFDEATSALDNKTQKHISDSLESLNCTRIVVAHRLSTVQHCDRILVIDEGRVAEEGTYEELLAQGGVFTDLVERQRLYE